MRERLSLPVAQRKKWTAARATMAIATILRMRTNASLASMSMRHSPAMQARTMPALARHIVYGFQKHRVGVIKILLKTPIFAIS